MGALSVVDRRNFKTVNTIPDFWIHDNGPTRPFSACANAQASTIVGTSIDKNGDYIVHLYQSNGNSDYVISKPVNHIFPNMLEVKDVEVDSSGTVVFFAGVAAGNGKPMLLAAELNQTLKPICQFFMDDINYGKPRRLRRIKGYDILLCGCKSHIGVFEFRNGNLMHLANVEHATNREILDMEFRNGILWSKGYQENNVSVINFNGAQPIMDPPVRPMPVVDPPVRPMPSIDPPASPFHPESDPLPTMHSSIGGASTITQPDDLTSQGGIFSRSQLDAPEVQPSRFDPSQNKSYRSKIPTGLTKIEKVAVPHDKKRIYIGGKGMHVFQLNNQRTKYVKLKTPHLDSKPSNYT